MTLECFPLQFSTKFKGIDAESGPGHFPTFGLFENDVFLAVFSWLGSRWGKFQLDVSNRNCSRQLQGLQFHIPGIGLDSRVADPLGKSGADPGTQGPVNGSAQ
jgi:hypothetical protein